MYIDTDGRLSAQRFSRGGTNLWLERLSTILLHLSKGVMEELGWIYVRMNVQFQQPIANMTKSLAFLNTPFFTV
jgi:hypothetical protein